MKVLQLINLGKEVAEGLKGSFDNLPHTDHKDGKYRLRRYSRVEIWTTFWNAKEEAELTILENRDFVQSKDLNRHQGGMIRSFEDIEDEVLKDEGMRKICLEFKNGHGLIDGQELEIHQMRVMTLDNGRAMVSPEGVHQDGYDCIGMIGIHRHNIHGGELLLHETRDSFAWASPDEPSPKSSPFMHYMLRDGDLLLVNDRKFWHNASLLESVKKSEQGYGDWFILCANK